ncbi:MAG TPA: CinA family protein [Dehalococcoidia bacterium]|jgi:PncC family amidohydrolase|nr:CinA family protein [Dehalococcoidia bacterium]HIK89403.1 CinA family protein [Dehalococcoidia bacterium]
MPTKLATLANSIATLLKQRGETVAVAESSTGGLISAALLAVPGASAYFMGGSVVYTKTARDQYLGIDFDNHPGMRSASEPYAALLAKTSRELLNTTWGISETGASGPTGNAYGDSAGHTCLAVSSTTIETAATLKTGLANREQNMQLFAEQALTLFEQVLKKSL